MNKSDRAKLARDTIDDDIPQILKSNQRALQEVQGSELIKYSPSQLHSKLLLPQYQAEDVGMSAALPAQAGTPRIRIIQSDTYDAVQAMIKESESPIRIAALNMASAKQPGGGVLNGSVSLSCLDDYPLLEVENIVLVWTISSHNPAFQTNGSAAQILSTLTFYSWCIANTDHRSLKKSLSPCEALYTPVSIGPGIACQMTQQYTHQMFSFSATQKTWISKNPIGSSQASFPAQQ